MAGVGGSDAHTTGKSWNNLDGTDGNEEKIGLVSVTYAHHAGAIRPQAGYSSTAEFDPMRRAIFNGRTVASNGPFAVASLNGRRLGQEFVVEAGDDLDLDVEWQAPFAPGAADPQVIKVQLGPVTSQFGEACRHAECSRTFVVSDEQAGSDSFSTRLTMPSGWGRAYLRVEVLAVGDDEKGKDKVFGAWTSPIYMRED